MTVKAEPNILYPAGAHNQAVLANCCMMQPQLTGDTGKKPFTQQQRRDHA
jgi:hypothetical protein